MLVLPHHYQRCKDPTAVCVYYIWLIRCLVPSEPSHSLFLALLVLGRSFRPHRSISGSIPEPRVALADAPLIAACSPPITQQHYLCHTWRTRAVTYIEKYENVRHGTRNRQWLMGITLKTGSRKRKPKAREREPNTYVRSTQQYTRTHERKI